MAKAVPPTATKYIDPLTDFGFKRLFGTDPNKGFLIAFLNSVFGGRKTIVNLEYNKNEHPGDVQQEGVAIFDLSCTGNKGERFIIEVQRGRLGNFKQRAVYYTSVLAAAQAPKGSRAAWGYNLPEIYFVALLEDFPIDGNNGRYIQDICLANRDTGQVFYDGLGYIFLELVNFAKQEDELESDLDKWLYVLKHMSRMDKLPLFLRKTIFERVFSIAEYSNMTKEEKDMYNTALKYKWDNQNVLDYAVKTAREEERAIAAKIIQKAEKEKQKAEKEKQKIVLKAAAEKSENARKLKQLGVPVSDIAKGLGLSLEEVEQL